MMTRVLHLVLSLDHGGLERLVVDWTNARNRSQPGSTGIGCLDSLGELAGEVAGGAVIDLQARRTRFPCDVAAVVRLRRLLSSYDCLHSHNLAAWQYGALACLGTGLRHVHTEHGSNPHVAGLRNRLRLRWLARHTAAVVAVSELTRAALEGVLGGAAGRVHVILNGVAVATPDAGAVAPLRAALGLVPGEQVIGSVGRLAVVKGYDRLIAAFAELVKAWPAGRPPRLLLVGDGPERAALEVLARQGGIERQVLFTGYRPDSRRLLDVMDLFVLPSRSEGLSVALLEAMAAGLPVFVTDAGEHWQVVDQGAGVRLPEAVGAWSGILARALAPTGAAALREMGAIARRRVVENYGIERTLEAYEQCYTPLRASVSPW